MQEPNHLPGEPAVEVQRLVKQFPRSQGWRDLARLLPGRRSWPQVTALDQVNLAAPRGQVFGLLGPNGAGKTTLVKILCGLVLPTSGHVRVDGRELDASQPVCSSIGLVTGDERSFYWRLSGRDNLIFFGRLHGLSRRQAAGRADELLEQINLGDVADRWYQTYSAGMKQRLAIARSLIGKPSILLLDEPTRSLDPNATGQLHALIKDELVGRQGMTILLTTHRLDEAAALCSRVAILHQGRVRACGTLPELRALLPTGPHYEVIAAGLEQPESAFRDLPPELSLQVFPGQTTRISFVDRPGALDRVLRCIWEAGGWVEQVSSQAPSLDQVFALVTSASSEGARG